MLRSLRGGQSWRRCRRRREAKRGDARSVPNPPKVTKPIDGAFPNVGESREIWVRSKFCGFLEFGKVIQTRRPSQKIARNRSQRPSAAIEEWSRCFALFEGDRAAVGSDGDNRRIPATAGQSPGLPTLRVQSTKRFLAWETRGWRAIRKMLPRRRLRRR